jgi:tetratricopeptide (TPR) repeat protein
MEEQHPSVSTAQEHPAASPIDRVDDGRIAEPAEEAEIRKPVWPVLAGPAWRWLLLGLLVLLFLGFTVGKVVSFDIWWHIEAGRYFLGGGPLSGPDPFSFTAQGEGHRWIEGHWLYQILLALLYKAGGINLLILFKAALICTAFWLVYRLAEGRRSPLLAPFVFGLAVLAVAERFIVRPETASYLFIAGSLLILEAYRRRPRNSLLAWLILLQLIWVNVQGLFALGLVLIGCYLAGELIRWRINLPYRWDARNPLKDRAFLMLLGAGVVCLLVCLLNPSGIHGALFPLEQFQMIQGDQNIFRQTILEFDRPFSDRLPQGSPGTAALIALLAVSLSSFLLTFKRWDLTRVLLFGLFLFLGLSARRNIALFALVAAPLTVINFRQWAAALPLESALRRSGERMVRWRPVMAALVAVFLCFGLWQAVSDKYFIKTVGSTKFGLGVNSDAYPVAAADLIVEQKLQGPLYNELSFGGYLIHRLYPEHKVFIDGRNELYGKEFYTRYINTLVKPEDWYDLAREYDLQLALLNVRSPIDDRLVQTLYLDPEWALIQHDGTSAFFARKGGVNDPAIAALDTDLSALEAPPAGALPPVKPRRSMTGSLYPASEIYLGLFYLKLGFPALARPVLEQAVALGTGLVSTRIYLGEIYAQAGEMDKALEQFQAVIGQEAEMAVAYERMASVLHNTGRVEQALSNYKRALDRGLDNDLLRTNMGDCYLQMNLPEQALAEFERAVEMNPGNPDMRYNVAFAHQVLIDPDLASGNEQAAQDRLNLCLEEYQRVLEIDPQHFRTLFNLGLIYSSSGELAEARRCFLAFLAVPDVDQEYQQQAREYLAQIEGQLGQAPPEGPLNSMPAAGPLAGGAP